MASARNLAGTKRADKDVAFPLREFVAGVEGHAGDGNRGNPNHNGRFETNVSGRRNLPWALIRSSIAHQWPAVVAAGLQDVDLVAAVRAIFVLPHLTSPRM